MKPDLYIASSILLHVLLLSLLSFVRPEAEMPLPFVSVRITDPPVVEEPVIKEKPQPDPVQRKPIQTRRLKKPPKEELPPDSLHALNTESGNKNRSSSVEETDQEEQVQDSDTARDTIEEPQEEKKKGASVKRQPDSLPEPGAFLFDDSIIKRFAKKGLDSKKGLTFDAPEFKNRGYMRMLKERIESIWRYPKEAARLGISGDLYIKFSIKKDGNLDVVELMRTSGYRDLDEAAMKALKDAQPFWPLPDDWDKDTLEIKGHFIYIYGKTFAM